MTLILVIGDGPSTRQLTQAFESQGATVAVRSPMALSVSMSGEGANFDLPTGVQAVVVKKLGDLTDPLSRERVTWLQDLSVPVFNSAEVIACLTHRWRMTQRFAALGLPIPTTWVGTDVDAAMRWIQSVGDVVVKPLFTTKARGMVRLNAENAAHWRSLLLSFQSNLSQPFYCQVFVPNAGEDVGVCMVGGQPICAYRRMAAPGAWQTTTHAGGSYAPFDLTEELKTLCMKAHRVFPTDFTTLDWVQSTDGHWYLYEMSPFGGFRGAWEACGRNIASDIARHVLSHLPVAQVPA
jgi:tetrahydromethanopterin:alpha-L-glutamate ligase